MIKVNILKKIYRFFNKLFFIFFAKIISFPIKLIGLRIIPPYDKLKKISLEYSNQTRRMVLNTKNINSFNNIYIDTSLNKSLLCDLGKKYKTNKSPYNDGHRSGFTGFYNLLFLNLKNKKINFAEIGIENNNSTRMWRDYFLDANIYCFDSDKDRINNAKKDNLKDTSYYFMDVSLNESITEGFKKANCKFDVIIDDSTHFFNHQINIIKSSGQFLKNNGILIIEDIYRFRKEHSESNYYDSLKEIKNLFNEITFVETSHMNNFTSTWKNEKILLLVKK